MVLRGKLCAMLETDYYHPRVSPDVIGVEICAAFKNFFAISVGWAAGHLEKMAATENRAFNHNAAAIIFDQAIRELMILVKAHGGTEQSVWGMPGAGDLYVTCQAGRNSRLGNNLGRGLTYQQTKDGPMKGDTIEGAELGVTVAATLRAMMAKQARSTRRPAPHLALLDALTRGPRPSTFPGLIPPASLSSSDGRRRPRTSALTAPALLADTGTMHRPRGTIATRAAWLYFVAASPRRRSARSSGSTARASTACWPSRAIRALSRSTSPAGSPAAWRSKRGSRRNTALRMPPWCRHRPIRPDPPGHRHGGRPPLWPNA
jgi:hypothetical protein